MLMPSRVKFRKQHRGRRKGMATSGNKVSFGEYGMKALECAWIKARQIEAAETRMGKGKGPPEYWVAVVKPGRIMFELEGVTDDVAKQAFRKAGAKMPIKTQCVERHSL